MGPDFRFNVHQMPWIAARDTLLAISGFRHLNTAQEDINTWTDFIKNPTGVTNKDNFLNNSQLEYSRFKYDLHGLTLLEANERTHATTVQNKSNKWIHFSQPALQTR